MIEGHSNNDTEYEALIVGLELTLEIHIDDLTIYGDSELVIHQMNGLYHIKKLSLKPYFQRAKDLAGLFRRLQIHHGRRDHNRQADALASLTTSLPHPRDGYLIIHIRERRVMPPLASTIEEDALPVCNTELLKYDAQDIDQPPQRKIGVSH